MVVATSAMSQAEAQLRQFLDTFARPGAAILGFFAVVFLLSLLAARLLALTVGPRRRWASSERDWALCTWSGFVTLMAGSGVWTAISCLATSWKYPELVPVASVATAGGLAYFGIGLGQRLRMRLDVTDPDGTTDAAASAYVMNRMEAMSTNRPSGFSAPKGTDMANLPEDALSTVPAAKYAAVFVRAVSSLASLTPWHGEIRLVDGETVAMTLTRNGRQVDSNLIFKSDFGIRDDRAADTATKDQVAHRALLTAAAAFFLFRLSDVYPRLKQGLGGATRWRSVAMQALAGTEPWVGQPDVATELLARAVDADPGNGGAWLGYLHLRAGDFVTTGDEQIHRLERLRALWDTKVKQLGATRGEPVADAGEASELSWRLRTLFSLVVGYVNEYEMLEHGDPERMNAAHNAVDMAAKLIKELIAAGDPTRVTDRLQDFVVGMRPRAADLYRTVTQLDPDYLPPDHAELATAARQWVPDDDDLSSLVYHYNRACTLAQHDEPGDALKHLYLAVGLERLRRDAVSDPAFRSLGRNRLFAALVDGDADVAHLDALKEHAPKLASDGIRRPAELLARPPAGDAALATSLGVPPETIAWMRGVCRLEETCPTPTLAVRWTNFLTEEGVDSPEALRALVDQGGADGDGSDGLHRLGRRAAERGVPVPTDDELRRWAHPQGSTGRR